MPGYGGYVAWDQYFSSLPDGSYTLDFCARDAAFNERNTTIQIYKVTGASTWIPLYEANFSSEMWSGTAGSFPDGGQGNVSGDCYIRSDETGTNFNTNQLLVAHAPSPSDVFIYSLVKWDTLPAPSGRYLADSITGLGLNLTCDSLAAGMLLNVVNSSDFNETLLTYDGASSLALGPLLASFDMQVTGSYLQLLPAGTSAVLLSVDGDGNVTFNSREANAGWPSVTLTLSKFYQNTTQAYVQTNTEESLVLASPSITLAGDNILHPYDRIIVRYETTATNPIWLNLQHWEDTAASFTLSPAGSGEMTETFTYTGDNVLPFEQLEFTGLFDDAQYLRILSLAIVRPQTIMPELNIIHPSGQMAFLGSGSTPGTTVGLGVIPEIWTTAWGVDSDIANVTASLTVGGTFYEFLLSRPTWQGATEINFELSSLSSDVAAWEAWVAFWNATDGNGNYLRGEGTYTVAISARDAVDTWPLSVDSKTVTIIRDLTPPELSASGLQNDTIHAGQTTVPLNVTDNLPYAFLAYTFESLGGLTNPLDANWTTIGPSPLLVPATVTATINWSSHPDGNATISFVALDLGGWMTLLSFDVSIDNTAPNITIGTPTPFAKLNGASLAFHADVNETHLVSVQYSFQGGYPALWYNVAWLPVNVTGNITSLTGNFNETAWALMLAAAGGETDSFTIYFRATDLVGHVTTTSVTVRVDNLAPRAVLAYPVNGEQTSAETPYFRFSSIDDLHFSYVYYALSGSPTKFYLPNGTLEGRIDQDAWDLALNASVVITFHIYDYFGNEAVIQVVVTRADYSGGNVGPGFQNFIYAGWQEWCVLGVVAVVTCLVLYVYHRGDNARAVKTVQQALVRRRPE